MATERADSNYHSSSGASQGPGSLTLGDVERASAEPKLDTSPAAGADSQPNTVDDKLRSGIYSQNDAVSENRATPSGFDVSFDRNLKLDKTDPGKLANIMSEFGDLEIVDLGLSSAKAAAVLDNKGDATAPKRADARDAHQDSHDSHERHDAYEDDDDGEDSQYNGDKETQEALARLGTVVPRDSQIPDQLLQTLDRLNRRQNSMSA